MRNPSRRETNFGWTAIQGKTGLTMAEIEDGSLKANRLLSAMGLREQSSPAVNEASVLRQQAYTLLVRAYSGTRDAIGFARRAYGDVNSIAPSLFAGRGRRPATPDDVVSPPQTAPEAEEPPLGPTAISVPIGFPGASPIKAN